MAEMTHSSSVSSSYSSVNSTEDEEALITRMFNLVGERWTLIAGRIPGRTAEEIEKYWSTRYSTSE
uniref:MYB-like transcription factor ETC1 n=1 Tax=Cannabis sativa TaxID=3483 RepID=A0A803RB75_CANSA